MSFRPLWCLYLSSSSLFPVNFSGNLHFLPKIMSSLSGSDGSNAGAMVPIDKRLVTVSSSEKTAPESVGVPESVEKVAPESSGVLESVDEPE